MMSLLLTHSGKVLEIDKFCKDDVCITDIAHHLAKICRYSGLLGLDTHYSVAQHSVIMSQYARLNGSSLMFQKMCLLHDASEAYLGDVLSTVKAVMPEYKLLERTFENVIFEKFGLPNKESPQWSQVKELDTRVLINESESFLPKFERLFKDYYKVQKLDLLDETLLEAWSPRHAYNIFLNQYRTLYQRG